MMKKCYTPIYEYIFVIIYIIKPTNLVIAHVFLYLLNLKELTIKK